MNTEQDEGHDGLSDRSESLLSVLRAVLAKRLAFETEYARIVRYAIQERHHQRRIAEVLRPVTEVHVRQEGCRAPSVAAVHDLIQQAR